MRCNKCGKKGHPEFKCYANKTIKQEQPKVAKYDPAKQVNANKSWENINATNQVLVQQLAMYQQHFGNPIQTSATPQEMPTLNNNNLSVLQAAVMKEKIKTKYKEDMKLLNDKICPRNM